MTRTPVFALAAVAVGFLAACSPADDTASVPNTPSVQSTADLAELLLPSPNPQSPAEVACADLTDIEHMLCVVAGGPAPR